MNNVRLAHPQLRCRVCFKRTSFYFATCITDQLTPKDIYALVCRLGSYHRTCSADHIEDDDMFTLNSFFGLNYSKNYKGISACTMQVTKSLSARLRRTIYVFFFTLGFQYIGVHTKGIADSITFVWKQLSIFKH